MGRLFLVFISCLLFVNGIHAEEVTYRFLSYDADKGDYVISAFGRQPMNSEAYLINEYGETAGNRYNQIPRNKKASLWLAGWDGCVIKTITLSMCSNNKAGSFALIVNAGNDKQLYNSGVKDFSNEEWYGRWVSKDLNVYVNLTKDMQTQMEVPRDSLVEICVKGGTQEGSVYLNAITIEYEPAKGTATESPLGYLYEKLEAKSLLSENDVIMLYRSGNAAGDIDGMERSNYLDVIGITSTSNVYESNVEFFTLNKDETGKYWTLTDQYGRKLGAGSDKKLLWDGGVLTWTITPGYSGYTFESSNTKYGTIRYNVPSGSYARFALYTSTTLSLPYVYKRGRQNEPVISTAVELSETERSVTLDKDTIVVKAKLLPEKTTDFRMMWESSDENVASVKDGIVTLKGAGNATITAIAKDSGVRNSIILHVTETSKVSVAKSNNESKNVITYNIAGQLINQKGLVVQKGKKWIRK